MSGRPDKIAVVWEHRLEEATGVVHWAAEFRWSFSGAKQSAVLGYQTRCMPMSTAIHDEIIYETIPSSSPLAEQVTCLECLAREP